eukprot:COSAG01_NODE_28634_length_656_cov_1.389587_1_plen_103_part_10
MPTLAAALVFAAAGLAPPPPALQTWWHDQAERQAQGPVAFGAVRQSGTFSASVISDTPRWWEQQRSQTGVPGWERSFVCQIVTSVAVLFACQRIRQSSLQCMK